MLSHDDHDILQSHAGMGAIGLLCVEIFFFYTKTFHSVVNQIRRVAPLAIAKVTILAFSHAVKFLQLVEAWPPFTEIYMCSIFKWVVLIWLNTLRLRQNGCQFPDNIFKCTFLNENIWILIKIWLKSIPKGPVNNIPALTQIMAWHQAIIWTSDG